MREALDQWNYVIVAYAVTIAGLLAMVLWSWLSMKRAEARREKAKRK
jgi:hypothetical protein